MIGEIEEIIRDICQALEAEIEDANWEEERGIQIASWHFQKFWDCRMRLKDFKDEKDVAVTFKKGWERAVGQMIQSWKDYKGSLSGELITY